MRTMVFDAFSGASGDMILGTLISLGADGERIRQIIESAVDVSVRIEKVKKGGIHAVDVHIDVEHEEHARRYEDLVDIVQNAGLSTKVEHSALAVFRLMAKAESEVHGESLKDLHFHEVGQNDALADVIGSCFAMHEIGADAIYCLPINAGGGRVKAAHGSMPVPNSATLRSRSRDCHSMVLETENSSRPRSRHPKPFCQTDRKLSSGKVFPLVRWDAVQIVKCAA